MNAAKRREIFRRLQAANPAPATELEYRTPFELLVAVILSAQATDVSVNKATRALYAVASTPEAILALGEEGLKPFIGAHYSYTSDLAAMARFAFSVKESGAYEVRVAWQPHANRAKTAPVSVITAEGEKTATLDQTKKPGLPNGFHSLGNFRFNAGEEAAVIFRTEGAKGNVHIDCVQVLPAR